MQLEKKITYQSPEGQHHAKIEEASIQRNKRGQEELKIIFELLSVEHPIRIYMARRCYKPTETDQIAEDLYDLVGDDIKNIIGKDMEILSAGLVLLRGVLCDVEIVHIPNPRHKFPFCHVTQVKAPGTLVEDVEEMPVEE